MIHMLTGASASEYTTKCKVIVKKNGPEGVSPWVEKIDCPSCRVILKKEGQLDPKDPAPSRAGGTSTSAADVLKRIRAGMKAADERTTASSRTKVPEVIPDEEIEW